MNQSGGISSAAIPRAENPSAAILSAAIPGAVMPGAVMPSVMVQDLPSRVPLNGADYLMLCFDRFTRTQYGNGNTCHLLLTLSTPLSPALLDQRIESLPLLQWLASLRLKLPWYGACPYWSVAGDSSPVKAVQINDTFRDDMLAAFEIDPRRQAPVWIRIFKGDSHDQLLFSWHHTLIDAHGAEMLFELLGKPSLDSQTSMIGKLAEKALSLKTHFTRAANGRRAIFEAARAPRAAFPKGAHATRDSLRYRRISFSTSETASIDRTADSLGATFTKSCFYLATVSRALFKVLEQRGESAPLYVPVPHDMRRRKDLGAMLSNHVTFLFFRIPKDAVSTISAGIEFLVRSMQQMIEKELHRSHISFFFLSRFVPLRIATRLLLAPADGALASCFFSDTGDSLSRFSTFLDVPVQDALHFPPHVAPPGVTTVFSRFKGSLSIVLPYAHDALSEEELTSIEASIREDFGIGRGD